MTSAVVTAANRGGYIVSVMGISGFLPSSHLSNVSTIFFSGVAETVVAVCAVCWVSFQFCIVVIAHLHDLGWLS